MRTFRSYVEASGVSESDAIQFFVEKFQDKSKTADLLSVDEDDVTDQELILIWDELFKIMHKFSSVFKELHFGLHYRNSEVRARKEEEAIEQMSEFATEAFWNLVQQGRIRRELIRAHLEGERGYPGTWDDIVAEKISGSYPDLQAAQEEAIDFFGPKFVNKLKDLTPDLEKRYGHIRGLSDTGVV